MRSALELLRPLMTAAGEKLSTRVVIGTVKGDLHDIGKNIVGSMLEGSGFEVIDLGTDVSPEKFVTAVEERKPQIVCMSALLTVTMPAMKTTIDALKTAGVATARGEESPRACNGAQREWKAPWSAQTQRSAVRKTGDTPCGRGGRRS
jgi:methanogenic corrinoid protein MtbC1